MSLAIFCTFYNYLLITSGVYMCRYCYVCIVIMCICMCVGCIAMECMCVGTCGCVSGCAAMECICKQCAGVCVHVITYASVCVGILLRNTCEGQRMTSEANSPCFLGPRGWTQGISMVLMCLLTKISHWSYCNCFCDHGNQESENSCHSRTFLYFLMMPLSCYFLFPGNYWSDFCHCLYSRICYEWVHPVHVFFCLFHVRTIMLRLCCYMHQLTINFYVW